MDLLMAMRSFVDVIDCGGFAAAGRKVGLSAPMVGNHVRFLEARLGGQLMNRTTRAHNLTELGQKYLARCRTVLAEVDAADEDAATLVATPRGTLRVTVPHAFGTTVMPQIIARFVAEHPSVSVELDLDDKRLDLLGDGFDIAIRSGFLSDTGLITRSLSPTEMAVCAAPAYVERHGEPHDPTDLGSHACLDFMGSATPGVWRFETDDSFLDVAIKGPIKANSGVALREAALEGMGIVLLPMMTVRRSLAAGALLKLLVSYRAQSRPVQLLTHPDRQPTPKLRAFVDTVVAELGHSDRPSSFSIAGIDR